MTAILDYSWVATNSCDGSAMHKLNHTARIEITKTKHGEWRVWDMVDYTQVGLFPTLTEAKSAAITYYQIYC